MKIIHTADIHLGSKLASKFPKEISDERRKEILLSFSNLISYAKEHDIHIIMLSGDIFDNDKPSLKDKEFFYKAIKANPDIDFLYLKGNHDNETSYDESDIPNLKTFNEDEYSKYSYGDIDIYGIELSNNNYKSIYSKLDVDKSKVNIVMLHGEVSSSFGMNKIKIDNFKNKGVDYFALGHIHTYKQETIDDRGIYAYSGCLEGRGFDECGEKGFIVLDIDGHSVNLSFIKSAKRTIRDIEIDVTGKTNLYEVINYIKEEVKDIPSSDILRLSLVGELPLDADVNEGDIISSLSSFYFVNVKNKTVNPIHLSDYENDMSLIGEFIKGVYSKETYNEEEKQEIATLGLKLLSGREVE